MMHAGISRLVLAALVVTALPWLPVRAGQDGGPMPRIRTLVARGDSVAARRLADSVVRAMGDTSAHAAEALYWRGALATPAHTGRLDLSRVVVDHPHSDVAGDAWYRLATLDLAAGDGASARRSLSRAVRDHGSSATAGDAAHALGQLLLADGDSIAGCAALDSAYERIDRSRAELRNRVAYLRRPCAGMAAGMGRDPMTGPPPDPASPGARPGGGATGTQESRAWSAQVGAFTTRADAAGVVSRLAARGHAARVTGTGPYRVRVGRFAQRADAVKLVEQLKREGTTAIVVEAERP